MASKDLPPAAIEGLQILVCGLDIKPGGRPVRVALEGIVFPFDVKRGGNGTIEQEHAPKKACVRSYSFLDQGDSISGNILWGFSSYPFKRDDINVGQAGRSGRHSGQDITCRGICYLEIIHGWRGHPLLVHPRQELLSSSNA